MGRRLAFSQRSQLQLSDGNTKQVILLFRYLLHLALTLSNEVILIQFWAIIQRSRCARARVSVPRFTGI